MPGGNYFCPRVCSRDFIFTAWTVQFARRCILGITLVLLPHYIWASESSAAPSTELAEQFPEAAILALHPEWLALLHYEVSPSGKLGRSYVTSDTFFLASNGHSDPAAELYAALNAFSGKTTESGVHPLCRFPARRRWIESKTQYKFGSQECLDFDQWAELESVESISMVFATGHFSSPASFFGHNFLKINRTGDVSYLLDTAINFGAIIPENENPLTYLGNGIFGGYEAEFSAEPFYRFLAKYGEEDLRDVWEYELALDEKQLELMVSHLWELKDVRFPYYFFRENCAYHISSLLNLFTQSTFVPRYLPWAMPVTVFDSMMSTQINGEPLVKDISLHRSRRTLFQNRFATSSSVQKRLIKRFAMGEITLEESELFNAFTEQEKIWVVDALLDYSAFMSKEKGGARYKEEQRQLLLRRLSLKPGPAEPPDKDKTEPPHLGQRPSYTAIGITSREQGKTQGFLRIRPAYYDYLSLEIARKAHASFTLFDTQINFGESVSIPVIDLVSLSNLNTRYSGIAIDKANSWQLRIGNEAISDKCTDCNAWFMQWDIGKSKKFGDHLAGFALAGVSLRESRNRSANGALLAHVGVAGRIMPYWQVYSRLSYTETFNTHQPFQISMELENRFGKSRWWDVRFKVKQRDELHASVSAALSW